MKHAGPSARLLVASGLGCAVQGAVLAASAVPMLINYQAELRSPTTGKPVTDGTYNIRFRIYDAESGGSLRWEEAYSTIYGNPLEVRDGRVSVLLGSGEGAPLTQSVFKGDVWLEIRVKTETLVPRERIASVPCSLLSANSDLLDNKGSSDFAKAQHTHSFFPRPAYDGGWQAIDKNETLTLKHELGGNPDDYVVDLQFADSSLSRGNQRCYGGWALRDTTVTQEWWYREYGAEWHGLNNTEIKVYRGPDKVSAPNVRVRIWICASEDQN